MKSDPHLRFPLQGIQVVELGTVLAVPSVGQFLAELGATVIKIEPLQGDVTRSWYSKGEQAPISAYYASCNWGKWVLPLHLRHPRAIALVKTLVRSSDILITNLAVKKLKQYGLDYEAIRHERLIYGLITGYGYDEDRPGYDACVQAEAGFMYLNREEEGDPPLKLPVALMDLLAAHQLKEAILLALYHREKTGRGTFLHVSLYESGIASLANQASLFLWSHLEPKPSGSRHPQIAPYGSIFQTRDRQLILLAVGSDPQFQSLCAILNVPDLAQDPRFLTNPSRVQNRSELETLLQEEIRKWESRDLIASLKKAGIPHGLIKSVQQTLREAPPSVFLPERKGLYQAVFESTTWEKVQQMKLPGELGKDTVEILSRFLQMHENEIEALQREGVTGQRLNEGPIQPRE